MNVLAVDTTSPAGSVALLDGEELRGLVGVWKRPGHAETLLPTIDRLLGELSLALDGVDGFAVAVGPGSFTGLRIGIATMEGLAYSTGRPIVGVSSLQATAHRFRFRPGLVASFLDARRGEVFGALYQSNGSDFDTVIEPVCEGPEDFLVRLPSEPILVAGTAVLAYADLLAQRKELHAAEASFFLAEQVARIGRTLLREGRSTPLGRLDALYLRPSDAERGPKGKTKR